MGTRLIRSRGSCRGSLDADLFQEWGDGPLPAEEFFDGDVDVAGVAGFVDFSSQAGAGGSIEITFGRVFENGCHVGGDGVGPSVAVVAGVVVHQMTEVRDEGGVGNEWEEDFAQDF